MESEIKTQTTRYYQITLTEKEAQQLRDVLGSVFNSDDKVGMNTIQYPDSLRAQRVQVVCSEVYNRLFPNYYK